MIKREKDKHTCNKYELHTIVLLAIALKNSKIFVEDKNL